MAELLTRRECQVAKLMLEYDFDTNKAAEALHITPQTTYFHCKNIRHKMKLNRTFLAIKKAKEKGLLS